MKGKISKILVCMLVITSATTPIALSTNLEKKSEINMPSVIDQEQPNTPEMDWLKGGVDNWQQFKNLGNILEMVHLHIGCWYIGSEPITLSIKETLSSSSSLTQVTYPASALPLDAQAWFTFDFPDVKLTVNKIYYIVLNIDNNSEYAWSGSHNNPYPNGGSSHPDADWDYAFKTIVDKSKPRAFFNIFEICFLFRN